MSAIRSSDASGLHRSERTGAPDAYAEERCALSGPRRARARLRCDVRARRRAAPPDRALRAAAAGARHLQRVHEGLDRRPADRRRPRGPGRGHHLGPDRPDRAAPPRGRPRRGCAGARTLDEFSTLLGLADLFPVEPIRDSARYYRRWAFESAALDLALRQNGLSLQDAVGRVARARDVRRVDAARRRRRAGAPPGAAQPGPGAAVQARSQRRVGRRAARGAGVARLRSTSST